MTERYPYVYSRTAAICPTITEPSVFFIAVFFLRILGGYPNTYAYTKALSEGLVAEQMDKLPAIILRPSIGKTLFYIHDKLLI
jgi:nucleoside-diphosphate-sugar epimerase